MASNFDWNARITSYLQKTGVPTGGASEIVNALGAACQGAVERMIGRTLETRTYLELYTGSGKEVLFLRHDPIVEIFGVSEYGNPLTFQDPNAAASYPPGEVALNATADGLILTSGRTWDNFVPTGYLVNYSAGLADFETKMPPDDLMFAVTYWAAQLFRRRDRMGETAMTIAGQTTTFGTEDVPPFVKVVVANHRRAFLPC